MAFLDSSPDLQILSIGLDVASTDAGEVVCSFKAKEAVPAAKTPVWKVPSSQVGLPQHLDRRAERSGAYNFQMPAWVIKKIRGHLAPGQPLWLRLERPAGYLAAVPWERILQPALGVPILRLPEVEAEPPLETPGTLDVLLCASAPVAKESFAVMDLLTRIVDRILATKSRRVVSLHVFVDQDFYSFLRSRWGSRPSTLYDPQTAKAYAVPKAGERVPETQGQLQSPWLLWMRDSLKGRSVDVAHFLCHGYLSFERGALCFAESPLQNTDRLMSRFVGAGELATFLTQVGAWSTAFSSPPDNYSEIGLRLLADTLPQIRPGLVLLHDLPLDRDCQALGEAYRFLYAPQPGRPPASPALALRCQPSRVERPAAEKAAELDGLDEGGLLKGLHSYEIPAAPMAAPELESAAAPPELDSKASESAPAPDDLLAKVFHTTDNVPSWIAAATRYVEQQTVRLNRAAAESTPESAPQADPVADTLRQIRDIVAQAASGGSGGKS